MTHEHVHPLTARTVYERPLGFSADQMRQLDRTAIEDLGIPSPVLMERAALGVTSAILDRYPRRHTLVLCGRGNNGGDGLAVARQLHLAGHPVACHVAADSIDDLSDDAALNYHVADRAGVNLRLGGMPEYLWDETELVVDCLLGTGATGEIREPLRGLADRINGLGGRGVGVLAVDVPTGVDAATGAVAEGAVAADVTVTFHAAKAGLLCPPGLDAAGDILVWDIGIPGSFEPSPAVRVVTAADAAVPGLRPDDHKYRAGYVVAVAGSDAYPGAAALTARAAGRCGAGYVKVVTTQAVRGVVTGGSPEIVVEVAGSGPHIDELSHLRRAAGDERAGALAMGPGLGRADRTMDAVRRFVLESETPAILDADALFAFNGRARELKGRPSLVLTPHVGELAGLLDVGVGEVASSHLEAARRAARETGAVVLLKGSGTVIAGPQGETWAVCNAPRELATAGTGDVLTGCVGALLSKGMAPLAAARAAAWIHAEAASRVAAVAGGGLLAGDVIEALPPVVAERMEKRRPGWTS